MAYKVYVKKLSSYEKKLKQARHERRQAKQARRLTEDQTGEILQAAFDRLYFCMRTLVETDCPELLPLMGSDLGSAARNFSEAGRQDTLEELMGRCGSEVEQLVGIAFLGIATKCRKERPSD